MDNDFDRILDECVDRLNHGEAIDACLADYPEQAKKLAPLLRTMVQTEAAYSFTPSADVKRQAKQRFYAAREKPELPSFWQNILARRAVWATLASVLVIVIAGYFALRATAFPGEPPTLIVASPAVEGNFAFLVSDEVNAIADFDNLYITVSKVGVLQTGAAEKWVEFVPEVREFDLTLLPGAKTKELWRGNIPEGNYTKVVIYVSVVEGILKENQQTIELKLPSNKLQINTSFQVSAGNVTSFTYDLTVVKAGNAQGGGKYLLKPQVNESGASLVPLPDQTLGPDKNQNGDKNTDKNNPKDTVSPRKTP
jgi:hypothetical protein